MRILVADDDSDARSLISSIVVQLGLEVQEAQDGDHAVAICTEKLPDIAILDSMMPGKSGPEVCTFIRHCEGGALIPILILTALNSVEDKVYALGKGADDYLTKPFHWQELKARVSALLRVRTLTLEIQRKNIELQEMHEKLVQKEREAVVGQMVGATCHELGQPISTMLLHCHLLRDISQSNPTAEKAVAAMRGELDRMREILEKLKKADASQVKEYCAGTSILSLEKKR